MNDTLVIQSHTAPLPYSWLEPCLCSVRDWSNSNHYDYQFIGDELFDFLPSDILNKTNNHRVVATDLARLYILKNALEKHYKTVIWMDADFLIFNPELFSLPETTYAVGREVWVQYDNNKKLKVYKKVHNAFLMFRQGNAFLDFYADTATRLLNLNTGNIPPQFIGPKLLTALHNISAFPVLESAGMLSPLVILDVLQGEGEAMQLFTDNCIENISAANLCISSCQRDEISSHDMSCVIELLLRQGSIGLN